ncbi:MAG: zinc-finger domain-containing protein [Thermaurantiacus sp.]
MREAIAPPPPEVTKVSGRRVKCDGGEGALGHPRVWLEIGAAGFVDCPYCDRRFVLVPAPSAEDVH